MLSWIYAFAETGESRYTKIGVAKSHYHERFDKTQQCNPLCMYIEAVWEFSSSKAAQEFERKLSRQSVFQRWKGGGAEWFAVNPSEVADSAPFRALLEINEGVARPVIPFQDRFQETLNVGSRGQDGVRFRPHLYLITDPEVRCLKIALSAYNWPTVAAHYATYNPRSLSIVGRWTFRDEAVGARALEHVASALTHQRANPLGWYRAEPEAVLQIASERGWEAYGRTSPIDDKVHYTNFRVPAGYSAQTVRS